MKRKTLTNKQKRRNAFRQEVFVAAGYRCVICRKRHCDLDVHHITPRKEMPNGGYVKENAVALCSECHLKAELKLKGAYGDEVYSTGSLYSLIGSSYAQACRASKRLSKDLSEG